MSTRAAFPWKGAALVRHWLAVLLHLGPLSLLINLLTASRFVVEGRSMEPNLAPGRYLLVSRMAYRRRPPARGDIVVVRDPERRDTEYVKRIVGLPGEGVRVATGRVFVNVHPLQEPYLVEQDPWSTRRDGQWSLAPGSYFVLGDNRNDSLDSRAFGPVPRHLIVGKAWVCYWPRGAWGLVHHGEHPLLMPRDRL